MRPREIADGYVCTQTSPLVSTAIVSGSPTGHPRPRLRLDEWFMNAMCELADGSSAGPSAQAESKPA